MPQDVMPTTNIICMENLSPSWKPETIALLLNKRLSEDSDDERNCLDSAKPPPSGYVRVQVLSNNTNTSVNARASTPSATVKAIVAFETPETLQSTIASYHGLPIPMTHGYHHYFFSAITVKTVPSDCHLSNSIHENNAKDEKKMDTPNPNDALKRDAFTSPVISRMAAPAPPLHLQLMALTTKDLEHRLNHARMMIASSSSGNETPAEITSDSHSNHAQFKPKMKKGSNKKQRVWHHARLAFEIGKIVRSTTGDRPFCTIPGIPVAPQFTEPLLLCLRKSLMTPNFWPAKPRQGVQSGHYLTLRRSSRHPIHDELWELCAHLLQSVLRQANEEERDHPYTALAITHAFQGSPHIDAHDTAHQFVVALGDFEGGELCADEYKPRPTQSRDFATGLPLAGKVSKVNVHNRLGRLEGRNVHWVDAWSGERFSIVYYSTHPDHTRPVQPQSMHNDWMASVNERIL